MRHIHASCRLLTVQIIFISKKNAAMPSMRILSAICHVNVWQGLIFFNAAVAACTSAGSLATVAVFDRCADCRSWPLPAHRQKKPPGQQTRPGRI
jgi:hypothetical protein